MERSAATPLSDHAVRRSTNVKRHDERHGNQPKEARDAPEDPDDDESRDDSGGDNDEESQDDVRRFSVSSESLTLPIIKHAVSPEVVQPSEDDKQSENETPDDSSVGEEEEMEERTEERTEEQRHSEATEGSQAEGIALVDLQQQQQLQDDIEVLASHLQHQTRELETERSLRESLQSQLKLLKQSVEREMESILIENEALQRQNALLAKERDASQQRAQSAAETHDELLSALRQQQQREEHARTIVTALVKERDALKKQLDESKTYCRRLEDEAVALRAEQQHLKGENRTLQTAIKATKSHKNDRELTVIREQEQLIQSLRADLLQMEFEFKTLSVDKDKLSHRVATLQRQSECRSTSYDVISLKGDGDGKNKTKKRLSVITGAISSSSSGGSSKSKRHSDADIGEGFSNLMTLPNCVDDDPNAASARTASVGSLPPRARTPMGSLVSKTFFSAKKKLFQSPTAHPGTAVIPQ